ncbi:molybdopterin synthase catalytic subunit MoaE [Paraferrimonas sedimenticola]|uniref:Molybdopterin synthase catalytic subunit n=1 Tax=Paraferrimonas sedimenticola TaxID=375674 RepID=A0AA37VTL1_9GAMM|nr:molybdopterin synthase catalytic subunit MoaE [Paraferrimonas sedimenticola]GLP95394.1 molybdopterin guanine dinucleotide biosynthesis protein MoaE [Paraferrimonas sedimenticola]
MIRVQQQDFDITAEYQALAQNQSAGAIVTFVGKVRDMNDGKPVSTLTLEHYPGMTEAVLEQIEAEARERWPLLDVTIIHRVGPLELGDQIVYIGVSSAHRGAAFDACEYLIDFLKTRAPFWKLEGTGDSQHWVEAKDADQQRAEMWQD